MSALTASRVALAQACLGGFVLPTTSRVAAPSERGTAIHAYLEGVVRHGQAAALSAVSTEYRDECRRIDVSEIVRLAPNAQSEIAFAWSPTTDRGRLLASSGQRDYSDLRADEIGGTADLVVDAVPYRVIDYKTGRGEVDPPERNWQLRTLALAVARTYDVSEITVEIWKLREDGGWWRQAHTLDGFDLDATAAEIRARLAQLDDVRAGRRRLQVVEGDHCQWCPSLTACPAKMSLAAALVRQIPATTEALTVEEIGAAYLTIKSAELVIDKIRKAIEEVATRTPIPLPDGRTLALTEDKREYVVGEVVREVIAERCGADVAARVCEVKVSSSKAAISRELGKASREILDEIRLRGGMREARFPRLVAK